MAQRVSHAFFKTINSTHYYEWQKKWNKNTGQLLLAHVNIYNDNSRGQIKNKNRRRN